MSSINCYNSSFIFIFSYDPNVPFLPYEKSPSWRILTPLIKPSIYEWKATAGDGSKEYVETTNPPKMLLCAAIRKDLGRNTSNEARCAGVDGLSWQKSSPKWKRKAGGFSYYSRILIRSLKIQPLIFLDQNIQHKTFTSSWIPARFKHCVNFDNPTWSWLFHQQHPNIRETTKVNIMGGKQTSKLCCNSLTQGNK